MSFFKQRADFFKSLAHNNKAIAHDRLVEGEQRNSFFRFNDEEELVAACVNISHFPCLVHYDLSGRYTPAVGSVPKRRVTNQLLVLQKSSLTDMAAIEDAYTIAFNVMEQLVSAIWNEYIVMGGCGQFDSLDLGRFAFAPIGPMEGNLYGWLLTFEDDKNVFSLTNFDTSKWYQ